LSQALEAADDLKLFNRHCLNKSHHVLLRPSFHAVLPCEADDPSEGCCVFGTAAAVGTGTRQG
jgi:hypothetical protein